MRRVGLGVVALIGLAGCQTPFQGGEIFIFDYQLVEPPAGVTASDMAGALQNGAPASDLFDTSRPFCRAAFSGDQAPEMNRGGLPGEAGANISLSRAAIRNVSSLDLCLDGFSNLTATFGPPLAVGAPTTATSFALTVSVTGATTAAYESDALIVTLTDFDPATLVYEGEFEAVATSQGDPAHVLVISEGRFVLR